MKDLYDTDHVGALTAGDIWLRSPVLYDPVCTTASDRLNEDVDDLSAHIAIVTITGTDTLSVGETSFRFGSVQSSRVTDFLMYDAVVHPLDDLIIVQPAWHNVEYAAGGDGYVFSPVGGLESCSTWQGDGFRFRFV